MEEKLDALEEGPRLLGGGGRVAGDSVGRMGVAAVPPSDVEHNDLLFIVALIISTGLVIVLLISIARYSYKVYNARELIELGEASNKGQRTPHEIVELFKKMKCISVSRSVMRCYE